MNNVKLAFKISQKKKLGYININGDLLLQTDKKVDYEDMHIANYKGAIGLDDIVAEKGANNIYGWN